MAELKYKRVFFIDVNALVRFYFDDIGKKNLEYIYNYEDALIVTINFAFLEAYSALRKSLNIISNNDMHRFLEMIKYDFDRKKIRSIKSEPYIESETPRNLLLNYAIEEGCGFGTVDAIYLSACLDFANNYVQNPNKIYFVTSDKALYNAAKKFPIFIKAFNFWTCNLGSNAVPEFIPNKSSKERPGKTYHCRYCGRNHIEQNVKSKNKYSLSSTAEAYCPDCNYNACTSTYTPNL